MNSSSRRHFLRKSTLLAVGSAAITGGVSAFGGSPSGQSIRSQDPQLADLLQSYGDTQGVKEAGSQRVRVSGSRRRKLPVTQVRVKVRNRDKFLQSFHELAEHCDQVSVNGNTTSFARNGRYFVIENRVA